MAAKKPKLSGTEAVQEFFDSCQHPLKTVMEALHQIILETDAEIAEQVKWNAPAFYYTGEMKAFDPKEYKRDIVVFNIRKNDQVLLIFPTGSCINDPSGLLTGNFPDGRKMVTFSSLDEVMERKDDLQAAIKKWLSQIEKE